MIQPKPASGPFLKPPKQKNLFGEERRVGVEFEFSGIGLNETAELITELFGGEVNEKNAYQLEINKTRLGKFKVELDSSLFLDKGYEKQLNKLGIDVNSFGKKENIEKKFREIASSVVPFEIVSPPVRISKLKELEKLIEQLRRKKAKGTRASVFNAFGMHLNPEVTSSDPESLVRYIKAFILIEPWIRRSAKIDWSRRLTPYIEEYSKAFKSKVLNDSYNPDLKLLITDYIESGNTRNQSLDLLPLFGFLEQETTSKLIKDGLTSERPTFHYRLPNCEIENAEWSLAVEWNRWIWVERMAEHELLNQYSKQYKKMMLKPIIKEEGSWIELIARWMENE